MYNNIVQLCTINCTIMYNKLYIIYPPIYAQNSGSERQNSAWYSFSLYN